MLGARLMQTVQHRISSCISLGLCVTVVLFSGCAAQPRIPDEIRAIWVTRYDYKTPQDVTRIMENCADAGFNTVLFQVRGHGTAHYKSNIEPWDDYLITDAATSAPATGGQSPPYGRDPGWDPLDTAIREAHARNMDLHAWVNVMPAWRGEKPPSNPEQLYNKHPEWFWYDQNGKRQPLQWFYVSLNPCLPEVREYIVSVFHDIAARYDIDGLHMDYIRFPNEPPGTPVGSGLDYSRDARTLELYRSATGKTPDADKQAWNHWRTECVTKLVADIHGMLRRTRPGAALSSSVGSVRKNGLTHFQDGQAWMDQNAIDVVYLMNYTPDPAEFSKRIDPWLERPGQAVIVPGLSMGRFKDKTNEEVAGGVMTEVDTALNKTGHFCVFAYSSLFDSSDTTNLTNQQQERREERAARRAILLPYFQKSASPAK